MDSSEPENIALAVEKLNLCHVVSPPLPVTTCRTEAHPTLHMIAEYRFSSDQVETLNETMSIDNKEQLENVVDDALM